VLDAYFKSYFGTFVAGAILAGAFLSAKVTNVFVGRALEMPVNALYADQKPARRAVRTEPAGPDFPADAFLEKNLFDAKREDLNPEPTPEEVAAREAEAKKEEIVDAGECDPERCQPSSIPANLVATFFMGSSDISSAVFQATSGGEMESVMPGDDLLDQATVTAVYRNMVCVSRAGTCEIFSLDQAKKRVNANRRPKIAQRRAKRSSGPNLGQGVRKLGDKEYQIEKTEIDKVLSNLNQIARQARIVPSFKNGKSNGFKLFSIRPNSLYSKIGIQNGDIIQKINGYEINSPDKALEIYSKLKDADSITVDLVRRGKPQTMSYSIQ
jgi:general secretion pathway protein C